MKNYKYILIRPDEDGNPTSFIEEKEVEDMKQFLEDYGIEKLLTEIPTETDPQYWKEGSALLVSFSIKNVKIIETITKLVLE